MKCILGFIMMWIGIGMLVKIFLPNNFFVFLIIGLLIGGGYLLFCDRTRRHRRWDKIFYNKKGMKKTDR